MQRSNVFSRAAAVTAVVLSLAVARPGHADPPPVPAPPALPTASPSPTPSHSAHPSPKPKPNPGKSGTASPAPKQSQDARPPAQPKGPSPTVYQGTVEQGLAYWRSLPKTPSHDTGTLLSLLQRLEPPGAPLDQSTVIRGVHRFPIAGYTSYSDDWAAPRYVPYFHLHEGDDLFAAEGTPVIACADGMIAKMMVGTIGGVSIWLRDDNGDVFYYGHLRDYAVGLSEGRRVKLGDIIATVGTTGDAVGTPPHVHFEVHPGAGAAVNPKPYIDGWLFDAESRAAKALTRISDRGLYDKLGAARWENLFGLMKQPAAASTWSWTVVVAGGVMGIADVSLDRLAYEADLGSMLKPQRSRAYSTVLDDTGLFASPSVAMLAG